MKLELRYYGDPVLREQSEAVSVVDGAVRRLASDMIETMYVARGIGLAAQQVGRKEALVVIDIPAEADVDAEGVRLHPDVRMPLVLINPRIATSSAATAAGEEGCLSFPEITAPIVRPAEVEVHFLDRDGVERTLNARGLLARAIQHELDHLSGVLFVDRMSPVKRVALAGRLKRLRRETAQRPSWAEGVPAT